MSDTYGQDYPVTTSWTDVAAVYTNMAGVAAWVQNRGTLPILVQFSSSASAPTGGGILLSPGDVWSGTAAHCWVKSLNRNGVLSAGLT